MTERIHLCLADGTVFPGFALGARGTTTGEAVFTTGMTGYEEVLTDPSYRGQIVTMTMPHIGNTGIACDDTESVKDVPQVAGFVVRDAVLEPSSWRSKETLSGWLDRHGVVGITGVDTRKLVRHLRDRGSQNGAIGPGAPEDLVRRAKEARDMNGLDLVREVTPKEPYTFKEGRGVWATGPARAPERKVVALDFGLKRNILRCLVDAGCDLTVLPASATADEVLSHKPDGVFLSNGPGDPAAVTYAVDTVRGLVGKVPMFGICLGHQILALSLGAKTYKLKFGHRGINQPVLDVTTGKVEITTQNHGFAVDVHSLAGHAESTHVHLNDRTSEGMRSPSLRAFSVQYHPEAAAGPHDSLYLFDRFVSLIDESRGYR